MELVVATDNGVALLHRRGESWGLRAQGLFGQKAVCLARAGDYLYAGTAQGQLARTRDYDNWDALYGGLNGDGVHSLAVSPTGMMMLGTSPPSLYRSDDQGHNWRRLDAFNRVSGSEGWSLARPPYRPRVCRLVFARPELIMAGIEDGGVLLSPDGGRRWAERWHGLPPSVNDLAVDPGGGDGVLVTTGQGLFRSPDLGGTWQPLKAGIPYPQTRTIGWDRQRPERLMVGVQTSQGGGSIVASQDGGQHWEVVSRGLPALARETVTCLLCDGDRQFAGTDRGQLFTSSNFGGLWTPVGVALPPIWALEVVEV